VDDTRFRDQIALLEVDVVALEMMVLRVLSAEKSGKQSLDVAGLLKIRGSEIQQRYAELMMLAAGPLTRPSSGGHGGRLAGRHGRPGHRAAAAGTYFNMRKTTIYGGSNEVQRTSSPKPCWELNMDFDFTDDQESLRDAVRRWVDKASHSSAATPSPRRAARRARSTASWPDSGWRAGGSEAMAAWVSVPSRPWSSARNSVAASSMRPMPRRR